MMMGGRKAGLIWDRQAGMNHWDLLQKVCSANLRCVPRLNPSPHPSPPFTLVSPSSAPIQYPCAKIENTRFCILEKTGY